MFELYWNITTFVSDYNTKMTMNKFRFITLLLLTAFAASKAYGQERTEIFISRSDTAVHYRIPAISSHKDGTVISVADYRFSRNDIGIVKGASDGYRLGFKEFSVRFPIARHSRCLGRSVKVEKLGVRQSFSPDIVLFAREYLASESDLL